MTITLSPCKGYDILALLIVTFLLGEPLAARNVLDNLPDEGRLTGYESVERVKARMASAPLHDIEGIWQMAREGTVMGYLTPTSQRGSYDARIYTGLSDDHTRLTRPSRNVITLGDDGARISFKPYGRSLRFNWWRLLLPYMYRTLVTPIERRRGDLDGCVRVYPAPANPLNPRYL